MEEVKGSKVQDGQASIALAFERESFKDGWRQVAAMSPAIAIWGMVTGMAMIKAGLTVGQTLGMTFFVYAGSTQLAVLPLMTTQVPIGIIFLTALMLNLRFFIFGAMMAPHMAHVPLGQRLLQAFLVTDVPIGLSAQRFTPGTLGKHAGKLGFSAGVCFCFWLAWQVGSLLGIFMGSQIPDSWQITFTGTIALMVILIPMVVNRPALVAVIVSGGVAVAAYALPYRLGLLLSTIAGVAAAMCVDAYLKKKKGIAPVGRESR